MSKNKTGYEGTAIEAELKEAKANNRQLSDENHRLQNLLQTAQNQRNGALADLEKVKECRDFLKQTIKSFNKVFANSPSK